jgi:hypothetical protein
MLPGEWGRLMSKLRSKSDFAALILFSSLVAHVLILEPKMRGRQLSHSSWPSVAGDCTERIKGAEFQTEQGIAALAPSPKSLVPMLTRSSGPSFGFAIAPTSVARSKSGSLTMLAAIRRCSDVQGGHQERFLI